MKRIISILFIAFSLIIANGNLEVQAQPTISNNGMFYRSFAGNGLLNTLISLWEFNETSGTTAFDAHGSNDGTINGASINQPSPTNITPCYSFSSNTHYVGIPDDGSLTLDANSHSYSISFWVKSDNCVSGAYILHKRTPGTGFPSRYPFRFLARNDATDGLSFIIYDGSTSSGGLYSTTTLWDDTWHHVVGVCDYENDRIILYTDNVERLNNELLVNANTDSGIDICVGRQYVSTTSSPFSGEVDQVSIWKRALTHTEVSTLYNSGNGLAYINFTTSLNKMYDNLIPLQFKPLDIEIPLRIAS